jgi:hypothetical protein
MKIYKVELDLSLVIGRLIKYDLQQYNSSHPTVFIQAENPDEACHLAYYQLAEIILKQDLSKETALFVRELLFDLSIKSVSTP